MKKVIVIGANGQLGSDISSTLKENGYAVMDITHQDLDVINATDVERLFTDEKPDIVINTSAYHNVMLCEENPELSMKVNAAAPEFMSALLKKSGSKFIHFSTDYVFDGNTSNPYTETDAAAPLNEYGKSKLLGEQQILAANNEAVVMRVSGIYGSNPCRAKNGLNFVQLMLKLAREKGEVKVVTDEIVSPTYTKNIAQQVTKILDSDISGIVHATSEGSCSWNEFAKEIFEYTKTPVKLFDSLSTDNPPVVKRPNYSVLENAKLKEKGINVMLHWKDALHQYLDDVIN